MDPTVTLRCISRRSGDEQAILRGVATLARWDEKLQCEVGNAEDDQCALCGAQNGGWIHMMRDCLALVDLRKTCGVESLVQEVPCPMLYGLAPELSAEPYGN